VGKRLSHNLGEERKGQFTESPQKTETIPCGTKDTPREAEALIRCTNRAGQKGIVHRIWGPGRSPQKESQKKAETKMKGCRKALKSKRNGCGTCESINTYFKKRGERLAEHPQSRERSRCRAVRTGRTEGMTPGNRGK